MKIGVFATFMSPIASPEMIGQFGRDVENAGLDSLWMGEHVVLFDDMEFGYPASKDGRIPVPKGGGMLDTVASFGYLAAVTTNLRFGTGIALISQRNPVYTAKEFATLDWLTKGRIDFGIGVGWCKEEVIASGYSWDDRGERSDEFLALCQQLWTQPETNFTGKHFQVQAARLDPKPIQQPHIPIIVGGHSQRALRRAAEYGSGWYGFALDPKQTAGMLAKLDAALALAGRTRDDFEIVITPNSANARTVAEFEALGVHRLVMHLGSQRPDRISARMTELEDLVKACAHSS